MSMTAGANEAPAFPLIGVSSRDALPLLVTVIVGGWIHARLRQTNAFGLHLKNGKPGNLLKQQVC